MIGGWEKKPIGEIAKVTSSKRIFLSDYVEEGIPFWRSKEVIEQFHGKKVSTELFITREKYNEIKNKFGVPQLGDILLTSVGTIGVPYLVSDKSPFYFKDGNLTWIKEIISEVEPYYIYLWLSSDIGQKEIQNHLIGSSQKALTIDSLKKIKIPLPSLPIQQKVAGILAAYDDLIENNLKRIKLLEEMAQSTYEEWFVRLRFPGHESTPINPETGLPVGWKSTNLGSCLSHEIGGGWGEDELSDEFSKRAYVIRGTDMDGLTSGSFSGLPLRFHKESNLSSRKLKHGDIIFEVSGGSQNEGVAKTSLITDSLLTLFDGDVMCASFCKLARPAEEIFSVFLFHFLRFLRKTKAAEVFEIRSASNIVNYNWTAFLKFQKVKTPPKELLELFDQKISTIHNQIYNIASQNQHLRQARDILLPRLMTGMIDVESYDPTQLLKDAA
jgi:type I restriction enzyme S subunit